MLIGKNALVFSHYVSSKASLAKEHFFVSDFKCKNEKHVDEKHILLLSVWWVSPVSN
jgi:hypothetical protein